MTYYENVFIARQDISTQQVDALTEKFTKIISDNGGKVQSSEYWGLRTLAYRIKKNKKGHYVMLNIEAGGDIVQELERTMRIEEDIIRFLTTRVDELEEGPSIVMKNKSYEKYGDSDDKKPEKVKQAS